MRGFKVVLPATAGDTNGLMSESREQRESANCFLAPMLSFIF
jgi:pyruvate/2-oxoglutarate/acetoin dehydrogenase E1 component